MAARQPKVAIVADWLTNMGGAERVALTLHHAFPEAPVFTSVFEPTAMPLFKNVDIRTSYLQRLPKFLRRRHQLFPVFRDRAFRSLDLSEYDVVISSASAEAKAVRVRPGAVHICYCHTTTRYYWSHYEEYKKEPGFGRLNPLIRLLIPFFVRLMRPADLRAAAGVTYFIANSSEVAQRIQRYYHRKSTVIFPPVDTARLTPKQPVKKEDFYLVVGRQIPYKRMDLAIQACNQLGRKLVVIGKGSEHDTLAALAGPTVQLLTDVDDRDIVGYFQRARGFLWPQVEDFGVTAVEAMAAGTPVIAYKKGGALDYITPKTGLFFEEQTVPSLVAAIKEFESRSFRPKALSEFAAGFSEQRFIEKIRDFVQTHRA